MSSVDNRREFSDFRAIFDSLSGYGVRFVLGGGQAANLWAQVYIGEEPSLKDQQPFVSKDADFIIVDHRDLSVIESIPGGVLIRSSSPLDGQLAIFRIGTDPRLEFDILSDLFGIHGEDRERMMRRVLEVQGIRVIDPVYLLKSKLLNLAGLDQSQRQDKKHVEIALLAVRAHLRRGIGEVNDGNLAARKLIDETKLLIELPKNPRCKKGLKLAGRAVGVAVPWAEFDRCAEPKIVNFVQNTLSKYRDDANSSP